MSRDFPALSASDIAGARLYATRHDMIENLPVRRGGRIAEVGVALGEFSKFMIEKLKPAEFFAFDLFKIHHDQTLWGRPTSEVLGGLTHREFYERAMRGSETTVSIHEGLSTETLPRAEQGFFNMIYIDAGHQYEDVIADGRIAASKLKDNGVIVFNDYIMHDPFIKSDYGIVQAVNEMVVNEGWKVIGFALQQHMFCDIAIQRR